MKKLMRFGVSLDHHLLDDFDLHIKKRKYTNRSEALRDLIRDNLVDVRDLTRKLIHIQHNFQDHIMAGYAYPSRPRSLPRGLGRQGAGV